MMHRHLFLITGVFLVFIGVVLLISPDSYLRIYVVDYSTGMDFAARRFSPAVIGLGVLLIAARDLEENRFLGVLCVTSTLAFLGVAATGGYAWLTGVAKPAILVAVAIEVVLAALFLWAFISIRQTAQRDTR